jgi:NAD(P) transhydrogenase subunit alpha
MAAESGGNVEGSEPGRTVEAGAGVTIVGAKNIAAKVAPATTVLYARNLFNFVQLLVGKDGALKVDTADELIKGTLLTQGGQVVHDAFKPAAAA